MLKLEQIKKDVEEATGIPEIEQRSKGRDLAISRYIYMDLAYWFTDNSLAVIGNLVNRDHSTVIYSLKKIEEHLFYEPKLSEVHKQLEEKYKKKYGRKIRSIMRGGDNTLRSKSRIIRLINKMDKKQLDKTEKSIVEIIGI